MKDISNEHLLVELKNRFDQKDEMMQEQRKLLRQLEKINQRLMQSEEIQSRFLSNIRNEINNPLTAILCMAREMMTAMDDPEKCRKHASLIFSESYQLEFQLQNIFVAAELEAGQLRPYVMKVFINNLVKSTLQSFKHLISRKKLNVKVNCTLPDNYSYRTDPEKLKIILSNLIMNAIEFTPPEGTVAIAVLTQRDGRLSISVQDNGEGIAEDKLGTIFDRFVQLNNGSTKNHAGHGLGLSVVNSIVELLGGQVEVVSDVGRGTVFLIIIPESLESAEINGASDDGGECMFDSDEQVL
jgi:signal transduction histidine kinase